MVLLAGHVASAPGLEADDYVGDLHVPLLLQVSQDSSSEEHFALANSVEIGVQLQALDLVQGETETDQACSRRNVSPQYGLDGQRTMSTQACFPSMKPLGMAFGVRISYLGGAGRDNQGEPPLANVRGRAGQNV